MIDEYPAPSSDPAMIRGIWAPHGSPAIEALKREHPAWVAFPLDALPTAARPRPLAPTPRPEPAVDYAALARPAAAPAGNAAPTVVEFLALGAAARGSDPAIIPVQSRGGRGGPTYRPEQGWREPTSIADEFLGRRWDEAMREISRLEPQNPAGISLEQPRGPPREEAVVALEAEAAEARGRHQRGEPARTGGPWRPEAREPLPTLLPPDQDRFGIRPSLVLPEEIPPDRDMPGFGSISRPLPQVAGAWLRGTDRNMELIPPEVAAKLGGRRFSSWGAFRREFWKTVADTPRLAEQFDQGDLESMRKGSAPAVDATQRVGLRWSYEVHHRFPIGSPSNAAQRQHDGA